MKWIGQHIYDLVSRFRDDVYLEDLSTTTETNVLVVDSTGKVSKSTTLADDIIEAEIDTLPGLISIGTAGTSTIFSGSSFQIINTTTSSTSQGGAVQLVSNDGAALGDDHRLGVVSFAAAEDASSTYKVGASIQAFADAAWSSTENGTRLEFSTMDGNGATELSLTLDSDLLATFAGAVTVTGALTGTLATAAQTNITSLGTLTALGVDDINLNGKTITITGDTEDTFSIVTGAAGATTLTTTDDNAEAGHFEIAADGDIILDSAGQIKLEPVAGNNILLDGTIAIDAGVVTGATSITSTAFVGALTGQADTVATIAGLAPNTATTQASQPNITGVGTIGTGVWEGTAIATDQQKHLAYFEFKGYGTSDGTNYEMPELMTDPNSPFEHNTSTGSDGLTAQTIQTVMRNGGVVMPYTGVLKKFTGWVTSAGTGTINVGLFKFTPTDDSAGNLTPVQLVNEQTTASGNAIMNSFSETSSFDAGFTAGDIVYPAVLGINTKVFYFNSTLEVEWS